MPYEKLTDLPDRVRNYLPKHAQEIYKEAFNSAENQYGEESRAHRVAWSAPFWMVFNMEPSAEALECYLDGTDPYDHIHLMLFSHGVDSVGLAPIERWRTILRRARKRATFVGVDERRFPRDFATFVRYHADIKKIPVRYPRPGPMSLDGLDAFLEQAGDRYPVRWE